MYQLLAENEQKKCYFVPGKLDCVETWNTVFLFILFLLLLPLSILSDNGVIPADDAVPEIVGVCVCVCVLVVVFVVVSVITGVITGVRAGILGTGDSRYFAYTSKP